MCSLPTKSKEQEYVDDVDLELMMSQLELDFSQVVR